MIHSLQGKDDTFFVVGKHRTQVRDNVIVGYTFGVGCGIFGSFWCTVLELDLALESSRKILRGLQSATESIFPGCVFL
jgi:hypothetical protein